MLARLFQFIVLVAVVSVLWWVLQHPQQAAGLVVAVVGGVASFVETVMSGTASLFR